MSIWLINSKAQVWKKCMCKKAWVIVPSSNNISHVASFFFHPVVSYISSQLVFVMICITRALARSSIDYIIKQLKSRVCLSGQSTAMEGMIIMREKEKMKKKKKTPRALVLLTACARLCVVAEHDPSSTVPRLARGSIELHIQRRMPSSLPLYPPLCLSFSLACCLQALERGVRRSVHVVLLLKGTTTLCRSRSSARMMGCVIDEGFSSW